MKTTIIKTNPVNSYLEIRENPDTGYKSLFALRNLKNRIKLSDFKPQTILESPSMYSVQVGENQHIELNPNYLQYINHSCDPNIYFDIRRMAIITLKPIQSGEEIAFFYPSTEWKMSEPFECSCGSSDCLKLIKGGAFLSHDNLTKYRLSEFVLHKYSQLAEIQYQKFKKFHHIEA